MTNNEIITKFLNYGERNAKVIGDSINVPEDKLKSALAELRRKALNAILAEAKRNDILSQQRQRDINEAKESRDLYSDSFFNGMV